METIQWCKIYIFSSRFFSFCTKWKFRRAKEIENLQLNGVMRCQFEIAFVCFICSDRFSMAPSRFKWYLTCEQRKMLTITFTQRFHSKFCFFQFFWFSKEKKLSIQLRCVLCTAHNRHNILLRQFGLGALP